MRLSCTLRNALACTTESLQTSLHLVKTFLHAYSESKLKARARATKQGVQHTGKAMWLGKNTNAGFTKNVKGLRGKN